MKTLNRILIGTVLLATLFSCQDVVTYNDGYDDGMNSFGAPDVQGGGLLYFVAYCRKN